jgi:hypothetical protein
MILYSGFVYFSNPDSKVSNVDGPYFINFG